MKQLITLILLLSSQSFAYEVCRVSTDKLIRDEGYGNKIIAFRTHVCTGADPFTGIDFKEKDLGYETTERSIAYEKLEAKLIKDMAEQGYELKSSITVSSPESIIDTFIKN